MATYTDVFERKEIKYRLSARQYRMLVASLAGHMEPDQFGCTNIVSIYFDTPQRALIDRSLEKPLYTEKLRLRSYGVPSKDDRVFVEIKKKFDGIVYKRRVGLSYQAAQAYLGGSSFQAACERYPLPDPIMAAESLSAHSLQISREIDQFMLQYEPLSASMLIQCNRIAYAPTAAAVQNGEADDLRITFDADIAYRDLFAAQDSPSVLPLLNEGEAIMEIKSAGPFPLWLVRALDACKAYPTSFSKYGEAYRACEAKKPRAAVVMQQVPLRAEQAPRPARAPRHAAPRAVRSAAEQAGERLALSSRDTRRRTFRAPKHSVKKGNRCA